MKTKLLDVLIVTGMHRSGTSCLTELLKASGFSLGNEDRLMEGTKYNPHGYFENRDAVLINDMLLAQNIAYNNSKINYQTNVTNALYSWKESAAHKTEMPISNEAKQLMKEFISSQKSLGLNEPLVLKDPRFCITLKYWLPFINVKGVLVSIRHPISVINSLVTRDKLDKLQSEFLYTAYHHHLICNLKSTSYHIVDYEQLLNNFNAECELINQYFSSLSLTNRIKHSDHATIDPQLNHFDSGKVKYPFYDNLVESRVFDANNTILLETLMGSLQSTMQRERIHNIELVNVLKNTLHRMNNHIIFSKVLKLWRWLKSDNTFARYK